jgi:hypothetical protein
VYWLPGFNFIRVPSRFTLVAVLGLAVLAAFGFDRLTARLSSRGRAVAALVAGVLLVGEFWVPFEVQPYPFSIPAVDRWLDTQPKPFSIAEVPLANPRNLGARERRHTTYMLHSTAHWQKTVEGYSGIRTPLHEKLYADLFEFPSDASVQALRDLGITYLVVHMDAYEPDERAQVEARLREFQQRLTLVHEEEDGRVYRIASASHTS